MIEKFNGTDLNQWLHHLEQGVLGGQIKLGLSRVSQVRQRLDLQPRCPVIVVGGTNGKGSVCAYLTQIYAEAGYKVGTLTSPHLLRFNERIALDGVAVSDAEIVAAFERIEAARSEIALSYFEFNTLAAVDIFIRQQVDVMVLEVGMGGRLDAVNVFDADVAVITNIGLDHQAYLGQTTEEIAGEKAAIMRSGKAVVYGELTPPNRLMQYAEETGADLLLLGRDFGFRKLQQLQWSFRFHPRCEAAGLAEHARHALPMPALRGQFQLNNAACALAVVECLHAALPIDIGAVKRGLSRVSHPARFQVLPGRPMTILDVGHNAPAAQVLRSSLIELPYAEKRFAVFSMLADKDVDAVLDIVRDQFDEWFIAPLDMPRGMDLQALQSCFKQHDMGMVHAFAHVRQAYQAALSAAGENDRIVIFGSFHTVAEVLASM